ncbi:MAG: hypothetical protein ACKOB9_01660 [Solirubrobacterales bacterium]
MTDSGHRTSAENSRVSEDGAGPEGVRAGPAWLAATGLAALLLLAATALPVLEVSVRGEAVGALSRSGWELHGPLLPILAAVAVGGAVIAARGRLAGAFAIAASGLAALAVIIAGEAPDIGATGLVPGSLAQGTASAGPGFYIAMLAGVLLLLTGGLLALRSYEG